MKLAVLLLVATTTGAMGCSLVDSDSDSNRDDYRRNDNYRYDERSRSDDYHRSDDYRRNDDYRHDNHDHFDTRADRRDRYAEKDLIKIGTMRATGKDGENDLINIKGKQRFKGILFEVDQGEVEIDHIRVTFDDDTAFEPSTHPKFRAGEQTRLIDFPGNNRDVKAIRVKYHGTRKGESVITIWGLPSR